jgi:hypothetical protein
MDPDPSVFIIELQDANKKQIKKKFFCIILFKGTFTSFFKGKKSKRSHKTVSRNQGFSYHFCVMIEGSEAKSGSGSIPLINGSGSNGPKTPGSGGSGSATLVPSP